MIASFFFNSLYYDLVHFWRILLIIWQHMNYVQSLIKFRLLFRSKRSRKAWNFFFKASLLFVLIFLNLFNVLGQSVFVVELCLNIDVGISFTSVNLLIIDNLLLRVSSVVALAVVHEGRYHWLIFRGEILLLAKILLNFTFFGRFSLFLILSLFPF